MSDKKISQEILVLRAEKGWTQQQFAEKLKTSQRTVAAWEAGDSVPRKTMKVKIAQLFGLPSDYFLTSESEEAIEGQNGTGTDVNEYEIPREKGVLGDIENLVSSNYQGMDEEKKSQIMEAIQGILDTIENNKGGRTL
jgi:transcriptional regulator with XRE-family HTH domain